MSLHPRSVGFMDIQNDSYHWIFHSSQQEDQFWPSDHGRDHQESTICTGKLLPLSKVPADCLRAQTDGGTSRYICQKQAD